jgi:hypothetical protein
LAVFLEVDFFAVDFFVPAFFAVDFGVLDFVARAEMFFFAVCAFAFTVPLTSWTVE